MGGNGKSTMKISTKSLVLAFALVLGFIIPTGLAGCNNTPSKEACLVSGDPECKGISINSDCSSDQNIGKSCVTDDNTTGHWVCTSGGMRCQGPTPDGGTGGDGGGGGYNCHTDPNNGKTCTPPTGGTGKWGCNSLGTGLFCYSDTPTPDGGTGGEGGAGGDSGGSGGDGGGSTPTDCHDMAGYYGPCTTPDGHIGVKVCDPTGSTKPLICQCTVDCSGSPDGGTGGSDGGVYNCATDPKLGEVCTNGVGACSRAGIKVCNPAGDGLVCNAVPGVPALVDTCGNGIDDNCNGVIDEPTCSSSPDGGTGGSGGGPSGDVSCTTAPFANALLTGNSGLTTLLKGAASPDTGNPKTLLGFANLNLLSVAAQGGLSISTSTVDAQMNYWQACVPKVGSSLPPKPEDCTGDVLPLIDNLYCRQLGIDPPSPEACNASVLGDRKSLPYMSSIRIDFECWKNGGASCPVTIAGHVPGTLFVLKKVISNASSLSGYNFSGIVPGILQMPAKCP